MKPIGTLITDDSISLVLDYQPHVINSSHPNFEIIKEKLYNQDYQDLKYLIDLTTRVKYQLEAQNSRTVHGNLTIKGNQIFYNDQPISQSLSAKLIEDLENGHDVTGFCKFVENLMENPSRTAVRELYLFIEQANMPITEDGCFLAYKKVRDTYKDIYSNTLDNSPGQILTVPRNSVDEDRSNTCSQGLHFCSYEYLSQFGSSSTKDRVVILKINPRDVVTIPDDYSNTKGRCCAYEVLKDITEHVDRDVFEGTHGNDWLPEDDEDDIDEIDLYDDLSETYYIV